LLSFRCTGCGNCCKEPLLPLTDSDLRSIVKRTGDRPRDIVRWVSRHEIDLDGEPEAFALLRPGRRVMVLAHTRRGCRYLGKDDRCTIYGARPLGCRVFPFDPTFKKDGQLKRLTLIPAANCLYEMDGNNSIEQIQKQHEAFDRQTDRYHERVALWNADQLKRKRRGLAAQQPAAFFEFLGF
jgi:Fe-S-cluster containining protein